MKKLLIYLKKYRIEAVLAPVFKLLEASFELFVPLVVARIIDVGIFSGNTTEVWKNGGLLVLLAAIGFSCTLVAQYFAAKAAVGFATELRSSLFRKIQNFTFSNRDDVGSSTMITRLTSDINQIQTGLNLFLRLFMRSPFIVFGAMIMAFTVNVKAALVFVVTIPLLSVVVFGIMLLSIPLFKQVQSGLDRVLLRTRENLSGARVLRAFAKEEEETEHFAEENQFLTNLQMFVGRISALMNPLTYILINAAIIAVIWIGGNEVYGGVISQGEVVALVNYMSQILVELVKLANLIITINKSLACASRVEDLMATIPDMKEGSRISESDSDYTVEFDQVSLTYPKASAPSLSKVDIKVKHGQTIGVIGGTGSGKSSLVNLIPRFYDVTEGCVKVEGIDVRDYTYGGLRSQIGIVMQKAVLFSGTIRDNLLWGNPEATEADLWDALRIAQAYDMVQEKGLDAPVEEGGKNLSGGQKQRLTIARALVKKPKILILDDSASALDYATDAALRTAIRESNIADTVFIVSQRTSSIRHADVILVLDDGEVAGIGTHDELLGTCPVYQEIHYTQYGKEEQSC